jgi:hypothetical protein
MQWHAVVTYYMISESEIEVFKVLRRKKGKWLTNGDLHALCEHISRRAVFMYTKRWAENGMVDSVELFPSRKFRLPVRRKKGTYMKSLEAIIEVLS